jgi:hypothetical protein
MSGNLYWTLELPSFLSLPPGAERGLRMDVRKMLAWWRVSMGPWCSIAHEPETPLPCLHSLLRIEVPLFSPSSFHHTEVSLLYPGFIT